MKYVVCLDIGRETVSVSGDISRPFGAESMYEVGVPCSHITEEPDPYYPTKVSLSFYYGGSDIRFHRRMTIMKALTGELKVWPSYAFPQGHTWYLASETETSG